MRDFCHRMTIGFVVQFSQGSLLESDKRAIAHHAPGRRILGKL